MKESSLREGFNRPDKPAYSKRHYTHADLVRKLDGYASIAKTGVQKKTVIDMKDSYHDDKAKTDANRGIRNVNFTLGVRTGIHLDMKQSLEKLEKNDKMSDQYKIDQTVKKAHHYYHRNYSLSKTFHPMAKGKDKPKDKGAMDKG